MLLKPYGLQSLTRLSRLSMPWSDAAPPTRSPMCAHSESIGVLWYYDLMILLSDDLMVLWSHDLMIVWTYDLMIACWSHDSMSLWGRDLMILWPYELMILWPPTIWSFIIIHDHPASSIIITHHSSITSSISRSLCFYRFSCKMFFSL